VVDDGSSDGTAEVLRAEFPHVELLRGSGQDWWSGATNRGVEYALSRGAQWLLLVNNDTQLAPDCIAALRRAAARHPAALIGCVSHDLRSGRRLYAGTRLNWRPGPFELPLGPVPTELPAVTHLPGRGMLIPAAVFERVGLFDAAHFPQRFADYDFSYRAAQAGFAIKVCLAARLFSHRHASSGAEYREQGGLRGWLAHLTRVNGPGNLRYFTIWAWRHCPRDRLLAYWLWGLAARAGGYLRDWPGRPHTRSTT